MEIHKKIWAWIMLIAIFPIIMHMVIKQNNNSTLSKGNDDGWIIFAVIGLLLLMAIWGRCI